MGEGLADGVKQLFVSDASYEELKLIDEITSVGPINDGYVTLTNVTVTIHEANSAASRCRLA